MKVNGYHIGERVHIQGKQHFNSISVSHLKGQLLKKRVCSPGSKLFPLRVDPI